MKKPVAKTAVTRNGVKYDVCTQFDVEGDALASVNRIRLTGAAAFSLHNPETNKFQVFAEVAFMDKARAVAHHAR